MGNRGQSPPREGALGKGAAWLSCPLDAASLGPDRIEWETGRVNTQGGHKIGVWTSSPALKLSHRN